MVKVLSYILGGLGAVFLGLIAYYKSKVKSLKSDLATEKEESAWKSEVIEVLETAQDVYGKYKAKDTAIQKEGAENEIKAESDTDTIIDMFHDFNNGV